VSHLLNNPNVKNEPLLIAEGLVLNFIAENLPQLKNTFQSPGFFPDLATRDVLHLMIQDLRERVCQRILPEIMRVIDEIDFKVLVQFDRNKGFSSDQYRQIFKKFTESIFANKDVRLNYDSIYHILRLKVIDRYVYDAFKRRKTIYIELVRVQQNNLKEDEYVNYLKILLLIKASAYMKVSLDPADPTRQVSISDFLNAPTVLPQFFRERTRSLQTVLPGVAPEIILMALKSNCSGDALTNEDASAKLLNILCRRFHNYKEYVKIDRGAESPDKSWFDVARKNAAYYGFDKRLVDELYLIAGDNNW
jgi:hypothetical protein